MVVKFERCHVLLPSWPTNSISSGGPEGLLTFGTADGSFSSSFPAAGCFFFTVGGFVHH